MTVGDERVRDQHRDWHGKILPIDHPFWKVNFPPNDWGCRCDVERTNEEPSPEAEIPDNLKNEKFKNNPGMTGKVFPETVYAAGFTGEEVKRIKDWGQKQFERVKQYAINYKAYQRLKKDPDYLDVAFDKKTGGVKATHKNHVFHNITGKFEKAAKEILYRSGNSIILESEKKGLNIKTPDGLLNNKVMDIKTVLGNNNILGKNTIIDKLKEANSQGCEIAVIQFPKPSIKLFENVNIESEYQSAVKIIKSHKKEVLLKEVWVLTDEEIKKFNF